MFGMSVNMAQFGGVGKLNGYRESDGYGFSLTGVSVASLLGTMGLEYAALFRDYERDRAFEALGLYPKLLEVRSYVRVQDVSVLSKDTCSSCRAINFGDQFVAFQYNQDPRITADLWEFWCAIFFLDRCELRGDELQILDMPVGNVTALEKGTLEALRASHAGMKFQAVIRYMADAVDDSSDSGFEVEVESAVTIGKEFNDMVMTRLGISVEHISCAIVSQDTKVPSLGTEITEHIAGYCYLGLFPEMMHPYVVEWLGAEPPIADLIDVMILLKGFGVLDVVRKLYDVRVAEPGRLHVEPGGSTPYGVLYDLVMKWQRGFRGYVGSDVADGVEKNGLSMPGKVKCEVCGFLVVPEGHEARCRLPDTAEESAYKVEMRRKAWLGDVRHGADVRQFLLCSGVEVSALETVAQLYTAGRYQAEWYMSYDGPKLKPAGSSSSSLSAAFEASYTGQFRADYVQQLVVKSSVLAVAKDVADFVWEDASLISWHAGARLAGGLPSDVGSRVDPPLDGDLGDYMLDALLSVESGFAGLKVIVCLGVDASEDYAVQTRDVLMGLRGGVLDLAGRKFDGLHILVLPPGAWVGVAGVGLVLLNYTILGLRGTVDVRIRLPGVGRVICRNVRYGQGKDWCQLWLARASSVLHEVEVDYGSGRGLMCTNLPVGWFAGNSAYAVAVKSDYFALLW